MVLDQSFTTEVFATIIGIPASKSYVRRHLATELDAIIRPARFVISNFEKYLIVTYVKKKRNFGNEQVGYRQILDDEDVKYWENERLIDN